VNRLAPLWPAWLREELAPRPGRWRQAVAMSASGTLALGAALGLQIGSFPAPLIGFKALLPSIVCTWRNLTVRLAIIVATAVVAVHAAGILVQVPWLLLPVFVVVVSAMTYIAPVQQSPIVGYCMALTVASMSYTSVFAPLELGTAALTLSGGFSLGLIVATAITELRRADRPHLRLTRSLSAAFASSRATLREAGARFRTPPATAAARATGSGPGEPPALHEHASITSSLTQHLQLLELVRQEGVDPDLEMAFVALITAAERIDMYAAFADGQSRQSVGTTYRRLVDAELAALVDAIDVGLARYADAAFEPQSILSSDVAPAARAGAWPDFPALVAALQRHQHALLEAGELRAVGIEESANLNGFAQTLAGLADVLDLPPEALVHVAPEPRPRALQLPRFDPYAAQFALKIGVACAIALLVGVVSHERALETIVLNPLILAQGSYGATIRKVGLRIAGVIVGGLFAILTVIAVSPNTNDVAVWLLVFFAVLLPGAYIALGSPRLSYLGIQVPATYMIVMVADHPVVDVHEALWRFFGTLLGAAVLLGTFQVLLPDYAGRQIISRFADLLRTLLAIVPEIDRPVPPVEDTRRRGDDMTIGFANVLRLAEEARFEGAASGVDRDAAVDAAGLLRRIAHRWALVRRGRRQPRPPLPPALHDRVAALEAALRAHLRTLVELIEKRHQRARTGSPAHRAARAAAAAVATRPREDLQPLLQALDDEIAVVRRDIIITWPTGAAGGLLAEVGHLRRLVELTPALGASLVRMSLPALPAAAPRLRALRPAAASDR
jgi:hypothetical protein